MIPSLTVSHPIIVPAHTAVLLLFMPPARISSSQRNELIALSQSLQKRFVNQLRVLRLDEATHPEVVRSFGIIQMPAFVLVRRGVELWRQEGLLNEVQLVQHVQERLHDD